MWRYRLHVWRQQRFDAKRECPIMKRFGMNDTSAQEQGFGRRIARLDKLNLKGTSDWDGGCRDNADAVQTDIGDNAFL
jgi:hypothetical protein